MITMDIFNDDAFSATSMTAALDKIGYRPQYLSNMGGLYTPRPIRTLDVFVEQRETVPQVIDFSPRGAPPEQKGGKKRDVRAFRTERIAQASTIYADEIQSVRSFGSETDLMTMQQIVAERQADMRNDFELTKEYHLLGMIDGRFVDKEGNVVYDWHNEFGVARRTPVNFKLTATSPKEGDLRKLIARLIREGEREAKGVIGPGAQWHVLCGDDFFDALMQVPEFLEQYRYHSAASQMGNLALPWRSVPYAGMVFHNYRGTNDNAVGVPAKECRVFPVNSGIFQQVQAPAERWDTVNTLGREFYSWLIQDEKRNSWVGVEMASYPLYICLLPRVLVRGRME